MTKITAHCLVKNEEKFVWYSIMSVLDHVDEILVWDNGSSDLTPEVIKSIESPKIKFRDVSDMRLEAARQKMIDETDADWIFILDGDEIWYEESVRSVVSGVESGADAIVVPNYMLVGDIYHFQEKAAGRYHFGERSGHYNLRLVRNMPGLKVTGVYGNEGFETKEGIKVQSLAPDKILFLDAPYLHASFLKRKKLEIGEKFPPDFYYPEAFFLDRPDIVPSVWEPMDFGFKFVSFFATPLRKIYRRTLLPFRKHGY